MSLTVLLSRLEEILIVSSYAETPKKTEICTRIFFQGQGWKGGVKDESRCRALGKVACRGATVPVDMD